MIKRNNSDSPYKKYNIHQSKFWDIHDSTTSQERNQEHKPGPVRTGKVG